MPTDGAAFGRTRPCYGKAYTMARDGADNADVAECVMRGVELDIRRDGGAPAYPVAVDLLTLASSGGLSDQKLLAGVDAIRRDFVDSPLTRHFAAAVETIGLSAIFEGRSLSREQAARMLLVQVAESRCCDGMTGYVARTRTKDLAASHGIVGSIKSQLAQTAAALPDDSKNYSTDIFNPRRPLREAEWLSLSKLTVQADSLASCLRAKQPWPGLCAKWPDLLRTEIELDSPAFRESLINLLRRHVDEWRSFSSAIHSDSLALAA